MMLSIRAINNMLIVLVVVSISWTSSCFADDKNNQIIRLATTTSTENSGLLHELLPHFTNQTGYKVHVIAVGTGKALRMGRDGDVDVVLVHAPIAEAKFIDAKYGHKRHPVMFNDFVIIGPPDDPADIKNARNAADAFASIAAHAAIFISRGDDSGTHKKEHELWQATNMQTQGQWYRMAGQGMGKVIQMATEMNAYTLADRGTWMAYRDKSTLDVLFQGDPVLHNPYGIIAVNPQRYPDLNYTGAKALIHWITSEAGQQLIANYTITGFRLFTPAANTGVISHSHSPEMH